ncbi:uncharacterized protein [Cicer arietinum]|uniref:uncharacterized protein n=1 Tax=Cicer arietinum TaxID=3827 RepID=UPI003CC5CB8A
MNRKFGGGKQPTGTPSLPLSCVVVICSLLAGASIVHNIYKPNLARFIYGQKICAAALRRRRKQCQRFYLQICSINFHHYQNNWEKRIAKFGEEALPPVDGIDGTKKKVDEKE